MRRTGSKANSFSDIITHLDRLAGGLAANAADLPHLETHRTQLSALLDDVHAADKQQKEHKAAKQDLSRKLETLLVQGQKLATYLRAGVKQHFGAEGEKLVEFDMQPFRGRTRASAAAKQKQPQEPPATPGAPEAPEPTSPAKA
jgi:peptidoglycan hydrolase CwlO-like protein